MSDIPTKTFELQPKQIEALKLAAGPAKHILFTGGGRAGKSYAICYIILQRALQIPNSRHGIFRHTLKSCRDTIFELTMPQVIKDAYPDLMKVLDINKTDATITFPNGSKILHFGLDSDERLDAVLGHEFVTLWANECSLINYKQINKLNSRLAQKCFTQAGKPARTRFLYDQNPTTNRHWSSRLWREGVHPLTGLKIKNPENYAYLKMTPHDNIANIAEDYIDEQEAAGKENARRFVEGDWLSEVDGAIFQLDWIKRVDPDMFDKSQMARIVVGVDPAISSKDGADTTGIIVAGIDHNGEIYVMEDASIRGTPDQWAKRAAEMYDKWQADLIVAEKNQGGEMVEQNLKTAGAHLPVKLVHASRGKVVRAEPISTLYQTGKVSHVGEIDNLESEMEVFTIDYNRAKNGSPDRLDAMVWALWELTQAKTYAPSSVAVTKAVGFY